MQNNLKIDTMAIDAMARTDTMAITQDERKFVWQQQKYSFALEKEVGELMQRYQRRI